MADGTAWLLDADPAIRWQVLRDLVDVPASEVVAERARVAEVGWGKRLLELQADRRWAGGATAGWQLAPGKHPAGADPSRDGGVDGKSSRGTTLRALRVLRWYDAEQPRPPGHERR